jgi:hypothetical protein
MLGKDGDVVIKRKDFNALKPATFILKKQLEIRRRELDDPTPIESVLKPEAKRKRGRPRKEIAPIE